MEPRIELLRISLLLAFLFDKGLYAVEKLSFFLRGVLPIGVDCCRWAKGPADNSSAGIIGFVYLLFIYLSLKLLFILTIFKYYTINTV